MSTSDNPGNFWQFRTHIPRKCWYWYSFHNLIGVTVRNIGREKIKWAISYKTTVHHIKILFSIWKDKTNYTHNTYCPGKYPFVYRTGNAHSQSRKARGNPPNVNPPSYLCQYEIEKALCSLISFWPLIPICPIHELSSLVFSFPQPLPPVYSLECQFTKYYIFSNSFLNFSFASIP